MFWDIEARRMMLIKVPVIRSISSGDLIYNMVIIVINTVLYA